MQHYDTDGHGSTVLLITNIEPVLGVEEILRKIALDHPQEIVPVLCTGGPTRAPHVKSIMCYFDKEDHAVDAFLALNRQEVQGLKVMSYLLVCMPPLVPHLVIKFNEMTGHFLSSYSLARRSAFSSLKTKHA